MQLETELIEKCRKTQKCEVVTVKRRQNLLINNDPDNNVKTVEKVMYTVRKHLPVLVLVNVYLNSKKKI